MVSAKYEAGRPWTRYEAYQLILQGQADALIAHGAHPSVKKAVLQLYFAYLSKLEVAFVGEKNTCLIPRALQDAEFTGWHRELHRGGMENPEIKVKARQRKLAKTLRACRANRRKKKQVDEGDSPIEEDDDDDDDDKESVLDLPLPVDPEDGSEAEDVPKTACNSKHSTSKPRMGKQVVLLNIQYMNLRRTLAFLYTACLFASPWITVSDIVRWVRDGSLPYLETSHLLHLDMKMSCYDQHLFKPGHRWVDHPAAAVMEARVPGQWVDRPAAVVMEAREQGRCWIDHPAAAVMEARVQGRHWVDRPSVR
ncbi:hypothetical protein ACOMHN_035827 [Nucella lapillus]